MMHNKYIRQIGEKYTIWDLKKNRFLNIEQKPPGFKLMICVSEARYFNY